MTLLPEQWEQIYLGELAALKTGPFGSTLHKADYRTGGIPMVNPMHIVGGKIVPSPVATVAPETAERLSEFRLKRGDVILGRRGDMGRCAVVEEAEHGWLCGTGSLIVRPGTALDPHYLQRFLSSPAVISRLEDAAVGSTMVNLNQRILLELEVPIPPLAEQRRIAGKLDGVLARVDTCCERLDRVPAILKRFRQAVLAAATSGKLTEEWRNNSRVPMNYRSMAFEEDSISVPDGWNDFALTDLINPARPLCYGVVQPGEAAEGGVPLIRVQDMDRGCVLIDGLRTVSSEIDAEYRRSRVKTDDLLVSVVGTIGRTAIVPPSLEANIARAIARIACKEGVNPRWVNIWLSCDVLQWWLTRNAREVARKTLNLSELGATRIALPPENEQDEIVRRVEVLSASADRLETLYTTARTQVESLIPALLAKAFRGELVPQDPHDEPASVLLERIRATRTVAGEKPPRKVRTERKLMATTLTTGALKEIIRSLPSDQFTFDDLRGQVSADYETLKDVVFALLAEAPASIKQMFDTEAKTMRLVRVKR